MIRIGKAIAGTISTVALVLGASVAASAQTTTQPSDTSKGTTAQPSDTTRSDTQRTQTNKANKGVTAPQGVAPAKETPQEKFDHEKTTLKDHVQVEITAAETNIEALKKMSDTDKGATKKRDEEMQKKLSDLRDHLQKDLDKIDKSTMGDWSSVRPLVQRDLGAMTAELRVTQSVTKVQVPRTGAASKQPKDSPPANPPPSNPPESTPQPAVPEQP
jgi:hypothetical protein